MSFCIVQTRKTKKSLPSMTVVPANWVEDKWVYWPPNNLISLSKNENSIPEKHVWKKQKCKLTGRAKTYELAEEMMALLEKVTDSEDAAQMGHGTRAKPAKKQGKFKSKSYSLAPSNGTQFRSVDDGEEASHSKNVQSRAMPEPTTIPENTHGIIVSASHTVIPTCAVNLTTRRDFNQSTMTPPPILPDISSKQTSTAPDPVPKSQAVGSNISFESRKDAALCSALGTAQFDASIMKIVTSDGTSKQFQHESRQMQTSYMVPVSSQRASKASESGAITNSNLMSSQNDHHHSVNSAASISSMQRTMNPVRQRYENVTCGSTAAANVYSLSTESVGENTVSQTVNLPVVIGSDGKQYAQLANGYYYEIEMAINNDEISEEPLPTAIKQDEVDLGINNDCDMISSPSPTFNEPDCAPFAVGLQQINDRLNVFEAKLFEITSEIRKTNERLNIQEGLLMKLTDFMANFNKLMAIRNSNDVSTLASRQEEDFSEFENMIKIDSDESFKAFEQSLVDQTFSEKFFRYLHSIYSLNGKRDSGPLFRTLIRKLLAPNVLIPYSWKGNKRTKKGLTGDSGQNINFQETFPNFIKTMHKVLHAADCTTTREQNENLFKSVLRYKILELKRFESGNGERRASSSRKRHKRQKTDDNVGAFLQAEDRSTLEESSQEPRATLQLPLINQSQSSECGTEVDTGSEGDRSSLRSSESDE